MLENYSRSNLGTFIFDIFLNFSRNPPKPTRTCPKTLPRHIPKCPKKLEKVTCASRESNPVPWDPESEDQPTRLFWHQKMSSLRDLYASKIQNWCPQARRGFFRSQNSSSCILRIQNWCPRARRGFFSPRKATFLIFLSVFI